MDENYQREEKLWKAIEALNIASQGKPYANTLALIVQLISTNVDLVTGAPHFFANELFR
jgi:hypothetical protein